MTLAVSIVLPAKTPRIPFDVGVVRHVIANRVLVLKSIDDASVGAQMFIDLRQNEDRQDEPKTLLAELVFDSNLSPTTRIASFG